MSSCIHPQRETTQSSEMTTDDSPTDTPGDQPATESAKPECTAAAAADAAAADRREKPEEYIDGLWEVEPVYYSQSSNYSNDNNTGPSSTLLQTNNGASGHPAQLESIRSRRGLIYKSVAESDCEYKCFQDYQGVLYRPGDHVFIETSQMEQPYLIGSITLFKMTKKDQLCVKVTRYFRPIDVPELSYSLVVQERKDLGNFDSTLQFHAREVFSSESSSTHPIHALRGKCSVRQVKDIRSVSASAEADFYLSTSTSIEPVHFFFCLNYNCDSGRLAAVQGEIRVGSAFQAKIPSCSSSTLSDEPDRDECLYKPGMLCVESEKNYVKMTRTFRTFSLLSNKRITPIERASRTGDLLHDDSLGVLHRCGYSVPEAVRTMHANDQHLTNDSSLLNADDMKRFGKGIKTYGKNFGKITRELLPFHQRDQLVSFYYLWKKSREATRPKPLARQRNAITARRGPRQITSYGAIHANAHHLLAAMVSSGCGGGGNGAPPTSINGSSSPTGNGGNSSLAPSAQQLATGATAAAATHDELMDYASASEAEVEHLGQESRACHHCFSVRSRDWHHAGHKRPLLCTECRLFYKRYGQMRPVDRPSTVPPCLHKTAGEGGGTNEDENEENDEPLGVRTRGAGRKERRRTPSVYDFNEATEGKVAEFRTPTKGELLLGVSNGGVLERRTTPQRSAKNNTTRKRTHRGSSTSGGDESSPLSKSAVKRAKAGITAAATANGSRTPSPRSDGQQQQSTNSEGVSKEAAGSSSTSSSSSSPEVGSGLQAAVGVKKEPIGEGEGETVLLANGVHKETLLLNGLSATGRSNTVSSGSGGGGGRVPLCDGKPVAKVEPLLDSAATATRKSGVGGQMELLKKADGGSPSKSSKANNNNNSKMSSKLAGATGARLLDGATCDAGGGEASSSSLMDSVAEGGVEGEDSSATMPSQDECGWKDTRFVRMWKRMGGLNMCSRTDLAYLDRTERYYRDKKLKEQQAALHQQQQDANAALATAVQQQQRHQQQAQQLQQHLHQAQQLEQQKQLASMQHILAGAVGRKEITQAEFEQLMALRVLPPPNGMMAAAAAAHAAVTATPSGLQPSAAAHLPPAATPFLASHLPLHTPPCMPPPFPGPQPPQMQSHQSSMQSGAPQNPAIAMAAAMAAAGAAIDPRMMTPQQLMILAGMEQQHKQMEQQFQKQQQQQQQQQQHHQQQQQQQQHQQHQQQQQQQQQQQKAAQSAQHHHGSITNGNANTSRQHLASHPGMGATPSGKQSLAGLPPATAAAMMTNSNSPSQHQQMVENAQRMQLLGNAQQQQQQLAAAFAAHQHQIAQQQQHQQHQHNSSQNSHPLAFGMDGMPQMNPAHLLQIMANDPQSRLFFERLQADFQQQQQSQLQQQQAAALAAQQQAQQQQVQQQQQHQAMMATMQHLAALAASDPVLYSTLVQNPALQQQHQQLQLQGQHPPPWQQLIAAGPGSQQQQAAMNAQPQLAMQELFRRMQHEQMGGGGAAR